MVATDTQCSTGSVKPSKFGCVGGYLVWLHHRHKSKIGQRLGSMQHGYCRHGNAYVHRLLWECIHGPIPAGLLVDHRDRDTHNNHIDNLRLATPSQSSANRIMPDANEVIGVRQYRNRWRAYIDGRHLGTFDTQQQAAAARTAAMTEYHQ